MGQQATQRELVSLIRSYVGKNSQVVMTASVDPEMPPVLEASFRADYRRRLPADIPTLNIETCKLIARDKAARCGYSLSDEYIASHANGEVRRLEGVINRLHAEKELLGSDIDMAAVKQACEDYDRAFSQDNDGKKTAYIMMGIQRSGKSEFCRRSLRMLNISIWMHSRQEKMKREW